MDKDHSSTTLSREIILMINIVCHSKVLHWH